MTITKTFTLEADEDMIDTILKGLQDTCEDWAVNLLDGTDFEFGMSEYMEYKRKLTKEIFEDVVTKLISDKKEAK